MRIAPVVIVVVVVVDARLTFDFRSCMYACVRETGARRPRGGQALQVPGGHARPDEHLVRDRELGGVAVLSEFVRLTKGCGWMSMCQYMYILPTAGGPSLVSWTIDAS